MHWFRLILLAAGLVVFLALRHFAGPDAAAPAADSFPAHPLPGPAPAGSPKPQLPFPQTPPESSFA